MIRTLIVDDEPPARARLKRMLDTQDGVDVVGEAATGNQAINMIAELKPDLLLLDISMPGLDGMSLAASLKSSPDAPLVVFCTAWTDKALQAFECDGVDYLVKPVRMERLRDALAKVSRMLTPVAGQQSGSHFLRSTVGGKTSLLALDEVICLVAEDKYTTVYLEGFETVINDSLVDLEQRFPEKFMRIHRNSLVAVKYIRGLEKTPSGPSVLRLAGTGFKPEVSRRKLSAIRKFIRELG